jgi:hypothetical protein
MGIDQTSSYNSARETMSPLRQNFIRNQRHTMIGRLMPGAIDFLLQQYQFAMWI